MPSQATPFFAYFVPNTPLWARNEGTRSLVGIVGETWDTTGGVILFILGYLIGPQYLSLLSARSGKDVFGGCRQIYYGVLRILLRMYYLTYSIHFNLFQTAQVLRISTTYIVVHTVHTMYNT